MKHLKLYPTATPFIFVGKKGKKFYKQIEMKTDLNVHEQICNILNNIAIGTDKIRVLDWRCGAGALSQRLSDMGFDVLSIDKDDDTFKAKTKFQHVDFDDLKSLSTFIKQYDSYFDLVIAPEVIEHVRDPWQFLGSIRSVIKSSGKTIITTPNTASFLSRMNHFLTGNLFSFDEKALEYGHITPVSFLKMKAVARDCGYKIIAWGEGGALPVLWIGWAPKYWIYSLASIIIRPLLRGTTKGRCLLFLLEKQSAGD